MPEMISYQSTFLDYEIRCVFKGKKSFFGDFQVVVNMFPDDSNTIKHLDAVNLVGMIVRRTSPNRIPSLAILAVDEIDKP